MQLAFGSNDIVRYKRESVITEFVINEFNYVCIKNIVIPLKQYKKQYDLKIIYL